MSQHRSQKSERSQRVVFEILLGNLDRLARLDEGGEVHDGIEAAVGEQQLKGNFVSGVSLYEFRSGGNGLAPSHNKVVEHRDGVSGTEKMICHDTADVTRSTGYENSHESPRD